MSTDIFYVVNLPFDATARDIREFFCPYGTVENVHRMMDRETRRVTGLGCVDMVRGAHTALASRHQSAREGRTVTVNPAPPREEYPPLPTTSLGIA